MKNTQKRRLNCVFNTFWNFCNTNA